jgi:CheY-like chemotaxis protein
LPGCYLGPVAECLSEPVAGTQALGSPPFSRGCAWVWQNATLHTQAQGRHISGAGRLLGFPGVGSARGRGTAGALSVGMKTVLLVNNDSFFRAAVVLRAARRSGFQLLLASSRLEALWALQEHAVDLVLVDLGLPEKEGVELLLHLANHCPELAVMTMSRPWEAQQVEVLPWAGHLSKPLLPQSLIHQVEAQLERREWLPLSLHEILRILIHERETCTLQVRAGACSGQFQVFCGELLSASWGDSEGKRAAREMLEQRRVSMRLEPLPPRPRLTLPSRLGGVVVEDCTGDGFRPPPPAAGLQPRSEAQEDAPRRLFA